MQKFRAVFDRRISPLPYVLCSGILTAAGIWILWHWGEVVDVLSALMMQVLAPIFVPAAERLPDAPDRYTLDCVGYCVYTLCLPLAPALPLVPQLYLAVCRLRDAGRPLKYLWIPLGTFLALTALNILYVWVRVTFMPPDPFRVQNSMGPYGSTIFVSILWFLLTICIAQLIFILFGCFKRKKDPAAEHTVSKSV